MGRADHRAGRGRPLTQALGIGANTAVYTVVPGVLLDPATFGGTALVLAAAATLASYIPARRASRVAPIIALQR